MSVLWNDRNTPLAKNSSNTALSAAIALGWDLTGHDSAHMNGVPWIYVGGTSPTLAVNGAETLTTVNGQPGRVAGANAAYQLNTLATNYGLQMGAGDCTFGILVSTPSTLSVGSGLSGDVMRVYGSDGTGSPAFSVSANDSGSSGWYFDYAGASPAFPIGSTATTPMYGINTTIALLLVKVSGVVTIYEVNVTAGTAPVVRKSAGTTATASLDATNAANVLINYTQSFPVTTALHAITVWSEGLDSTKRAAFGLDPYAIQANTASGDTTAPTATSASVANATPTQVDIVMSEAMDTAVLPAASSVTVSGHTVSTLAWLSSTVLRATVSAAFVNGEAARTAAYTQPGSNNARDVATNLLANFSGLAITNNVAATDIIAPQFSSAQVTNAARSDIVVTMTETLAAFTPATTAFTGLPGGRTVTNVARSGLTLTLTVSAPFAYGDTITFSYTQPGSNKLQDAAGNLTANFGPSTVTNNIVSPGGNFLTLPFVNNTVEAGVVTAASLAANEAGWTIRINNNSNGAVVATKTSLTTDSLGKLAYSDSGCVAGTTYEHVGTGPTGRKIVFTLAAT